MDWCVKPPKEANHAPIAIIDGDETRNVLHRKAKPREPVAFIASSSRDPDGGPLRYRWTIYSEGGTYRGSAAIENDKPSVVSLRVPDDAARKTIHVILAVTDDGNPPLTAFRRVVVEVE